MLGLLYKDLLLMKKQLISISLIIVFLSSELIFLEFEQNYFYTVISVAVFFMITALFELLEQGIYVIDENRQWSAFIMSMPTAARGHIFSRYALTLLFSLLMFGWCALTNFAACSLHNLSASHNYLILLGFMLFQLLMRAVELPFIIGLGSKRGNSAKLVFSLCLFYGFIVYLLFGKLPAISSFEGLINLLLAAKNKKYWITLSITGILVFYFLSALVSCKIYKKSADHYKE